MHEYYQNEPKFNGIYSRNNLPKIKDGEYVINLSEYKSIGIHSLALHVNGNNRTASYDVIYFDNFGIWTYFKKKKKKFIGNKNMITNIYETEAYDSIICGYVCIEFIDFMFKGKSFFDYTN